MMEIDPAYCDVIVQRFEGFSGKKAELQPPGPASASPAPGNTPAEEKARKSRAKKVVA